MLFGVGAAVALVCHIFWLIALPTQAARLGNVVGALTIASAIELFDTTAAFF